MASTAIVIIGFSSAGYKKCDLCRLLGGLSLVVATVRADLVRLLHFVAIRTLAERRLGQEIMSPPGAGASLGMPTFRVRHSTTPYSARWRRYDRAAARNLLFFQPVLLEARERGQTWVRRVSLTPALFMIQVGTTIGAQTAAVALADDLEGQRQKHLLFDYIGQEESFTLEKSNFSIVVFELVFFGLFVLGQRRVEKIERAVYFFDDRLEATRALQLDFSVQLAFDANLAFEELGGGGYFEGIELLDLRGMEIDTTRRVGLAYSQLAYRKLLDVKEHVFSASARVFMLYHY